MTGFFAATPRKIAFMGDWHANDRYARKAIKHAAGHGVTHIVHVGDFGWRFTTGFLASLEHQLNKYDITLGFVDGNHEDFNYLDSLTDDQIRPHIRYLRRGTRWNWDGVEFLALGGGYSVDAPFRRPQIEWWPQETIGHDDVLRAVEGGHADVMITHDCPLGIEIPGTHRSAEWFPKDQIAKSEDHRGVLRAVVDEVKPALLYHGHYHSRYRTTLRGDDYHTIINGLDKDGTPFNEHMSIVKMSDLKDALELLRA